jgi:hypothetical protein
VVIFIILYIKKKLRRESMIFNGIEILRIAEREKAVLKALNRNAPETKFCMIHDIHNDVCAICLEDFKSDENVRQLKCSHIYHVTCINTWSKDHETCCLCKYNFARHDMTQSNAGFSHVHHNILSMSMRESSIIEEEGADQRLILSSNAFLAHTA